jgi:hypothetical protein
VKLARFWLAAMAISLACPTPLYAQVQVVHHSYQDGFVLGIWFLGLSIIIGCAILGASAIYCCLTVTNTAPWPRPRERHPPGAKE